MSQPATAPRLLAGYEPPGSETRDSWLLQGQEPGHQYLLCFPKFRFPHSNAKGLSWHLHRRRAVSRTLKEANHINSNENGCPLHHFLILLDSHHTCLLFQRKTLYLVYSKVVNYSGIKKIVQKQRNSVPLKAWRNVRGT